MDDRKEMLDQNTLLDIMQHTFKMVGENKDLQAKEVIQYLVARLVPFVNQTENE